MFKLLGAILIIAAAGWSGLSIAAVYTKRAQQLRSLQRALQILDTEIVYGATPLPSALQRVGQAVDQTTGGIFRKTGSLLTSSLGYTAAEAWNHALSTIAQTTALNKEDLTILQAFGEGLGCSAQEEQHKNIALTMLHLQKVEESALKERDKNVKIWRYGGFLLGATVVLLLL